MPEIHYIRRGARVTWESNRGPLSGTVIGPAADPLGLDSVPQWEVEFVGTAVDPDDGGATWRGTFTADELRPDA